MKNQDLNLRYWQARYREYIEIVRGWSQRTVEIYTGELRNFFAYLERQGVTQLGRLNRSHLEGYRLEIFQQRHRDKPLAKSTQQVRLIGVKQFARFLYRENYLLLDLAEGFELPRGNDSLPRPVISEREAVALVQTPDVNTPIGMRDRAILEIFYGTGIRNSELRLLVLDQVDREHGHLRIDHGKGSKGRMVPLGEEAHAWLEHYLDQARVHFVKRADQNLVFLGLQTGERMPRGWLSLMVRRYAVQAGIEKKVTPHVLRHTCATHMLRHGANVRHLQTLLGHASTDTTQRYTRVELSDLAAVVRRCHPREQVDQA